MKQKIYVHVADDHKILIDGIEALLNTEKDIEIEGFSLTGKQVVDWAKKNQTDVLILDINMPELDGIEVMQFFRNRNIEQKTIILSSLSNVQIVQEMLSLGARGFIEKSSASDHIIKAIRAVYDGERYFSDEIQNSLLQSYAAKAEKTKDKDKELSEREIAVLKMVIKEYSTSEIATKLNISTNTVKTYRKRIFSKLEVNNIVGLAMYAVKNNIV